MTDYAENCDFVVVCNCGNAANAPDFINVPESAELDSVETNVFPKRYVYRFVKRVFDIGFSLVALLILSPLLLCTAIAVKVTSSGPVLFKQKRYGQNKELFTCYKFRSMLESTPSDIPTSVMRENKSVMTPIGEFIRKWSIDELPQLVNIIKGDIPLRILKMRPDFSKKMRGAFALPANEERTDFAVFPQVKAIYDNGLRNLQINSKYFNAVRDIRRQFFAKPVLGAYFALKAVA